MGGKSNDDATGGGEEEKILVKRNLQIKQVKGWRGVISS